MKNTSFLFVFALLAVGLFFSFTPAIYKAGLKAPNTIGDSLVQKDVKKFNYKIGLPAGWTEHKETEKGNKSFAASSESESPDDSFIENVYVLSYKNIDDKLKSYYKDYMNRLKFSAPEFKKTEEGDEMVNGEKAKFFAYTTDYKGIPLKVLVYIMVKNKMAYVYTAVALESTYNQYKDAFLQIARSIVIG